jgi:NAD(P)-dependent dehydrogenase (short-subunit alcohol dehydrogenase family)
VLGWRDRQRVVDGLAPRVSRQVRRLRRLEGRIDTLTIGLAREVAEEGVRVNAVGPGFTYTDIHASGGEPDRVNRIKAAVPMKRGGQPDEVARAILWLLSEDASFTTGAVIDVTGGM